MVLAKHLRVSVTQGLAALIRGQIMPIQNWPDRHLPIAPLFFGKKHVFFSAKCFSGVQNPPNKCFTPLLAGQKKKGEPSKYRHIGNAASVVLPPLQVECNLPVKFLGEKMGSWLFLLPSQLLHSFKKLTWNMNMA